MLIITPIQSQKLSRWIFVAVLMATIARPACADRWLLGTPVPGQPHVMNFSTPVPQDFAQKVMLRSDAAAPHSRSTTRTIDGVEYQLQHNKIGWDTPTFGRNMVTFENSGVGKDWVTLSGSNNSRHQRAISFTVKKIAR